MLKQVTHASEPWFPSHEDSFTLFAVLTYNCNQQCSHCFAINEADKQIPQSILSDEDWFSVFDQLSEFKHTRLFFTGGEPMMHPSVMKFISYASEKSIPIVLGTNATLITSQVSKALSDTGITEARVSIDGASAITHDLLRGTGSFKKTIRGISSLIDENITVSIRTTVNKLNYYEMDRIAELVLDLGVSDWEIKHIIPSGRALYHPELLTTYDERLIALDTILKTVSSKHPYLRIKLMEGTLHKKAVVPEGIRVASCPAGTRMMMVQPTGDVIPCGYLTSNVIGNITKMSLDEIRKKWEKDKKQDKRFFLPEGCKNCKHQNMCRGGCPAYNFCEEDVCYV